MKTIENAVAPIRIANTMALILTVRITSYNVCYTKLLRAEQGRDAFYGGPIAEAIVAFSQTNGGFFSIEDFSKHESEWVEPISTDYRGVTVYELPPNIYGTDHMEWEIYSTPSRDARIKTAFRNNFV